MKGLTESEARFRALFENAAVSFLIHNSETGELIEANRKAVEDYGLSSFEELKAMDYWLPEPYSLRDVARWVRKAAAEGPQRFEWKDLDREGRTYWRDISLKRIVLNGVPRVMAITQDITERKRAEESLKRSESENRMLINALPDLLFRISREGTIRDYRSSDASTLYVPPDVFLGEKIQDVLPAPIAGRAIELMGQVFASGKPRTLEYELNVHGEARFYDDRIVFLDQDEVLHVIRDITERKRAEEALRVSEERFRKVFHTSPDAIIMSRYSDGGLVTVNEGFTRILGYAEKEVVGKTTVALNIWVNPDDRMRLVEVLRRTGEVKNLEASFRRRNGTVICGL
ncbi:MAG TPA: PAS domain S-box protein, partial [Nitrospirota bacterium]|nr:PAS domain S-box protein [Nitrospirota bacterium]